MTVVDENEMTVIHPEENMNVFITFWRVVISYTANKEKTKI